MNFIRKKKRGFNQKVQQLWVNTDGYQITWRKEAFGISIPASYHACIKVVTPNGEETLEFVSHKRLYKGFSAAVEDCEKHQQLWLEATQCTGIQALKRLFVYLPNSVPKWTLTQFNPEILSLINTKYGRNQKCLD